MRIRQAYIAPCLAHLEERFRANYGLTENYCTAEKPCVFFGAYSKASLNKIFAHKSLAVVVWCGQDAVKAREHAERLHAAEHVYHIAISHWIARDLRDVGLPYFPISVHPVRMDLFQPTPLGKAIYSYGHHRKPGVYNGALVERTERVWRHIPFITGETAAYKQVLYEQMPSVYANCFLGLRLTQHDGLPSTVIELGLMGRRCVFNGVAPGAIRWNSEKEVDAAISREMRGSIPDLPLANEMREFAAIRTDWLESAFYA